MASVRLRFRHIRLEQHFSQTNTYLSLRPLPISSRPNGLTLTNTERINPLGLFRAPAPLFHPSPIRSSCPQTLLRILIHHPSSFLSSVSLSLHHSLSPLNTDRLSSPWSGFQILILSLSFSSVRSHKSSP